MASETTGNNRIDYLNKMAMYYLRQESSKWDSGLYYAQQAVKEAKTVNFQSGLLLGYMRCGEYYLQLIKPAEAIQYYQLVLDMAKKAGNDTLIGLAYRQIGQGLYYQGNFHGSIRNIQLSIEYFERTGLSGMVPSALSKISEFYKQQGDYEKAFEVCQKSITASRIINSKFDLASSLLQLGSLYKEIGDYKTALEYYRQSRSYIGKDLRQWPMRYYCINMGNLYKDNLQFDSALYYFNKAGQAYPESIVVRRGLGEIYLLRKQYDSALAILQPLLETMKDKGEENSRMEVLLDLGMAYGAKKDYFRALSYARNALKLSEEKGSRRNLIAALKLTSEMYQLLQLPDSALRYYQLYISGKDSLITDQFKGKLSEFRRISEDQRKLAQIEILKKEKQINEQQLKIQKQQLSQNNFLRNILGLGIVLIGILSFIVVRNISLQRKNERLKNERLRSELEHRTIELEMQALRAQMNPHFIFNCLTSINRFILKNETEIASDYLTRFSRLIRMVLTHSGLALISLREELDMLTLYLDMEQLRFRNAFDYSIQVDPDIDAEQVQIPPLLFQPFCENAIWHGLMQKEGAGKLDIEIRLMNDKLICTVTDNGIGRAKAEEFKKGSSENKKSMGLKITSDRLSLFNEEAGGGSAFFIDDISDEEGRIHGTKVSFHVRYKENIYEPVSI